MANITFRKIIDSTSCYRRIVVGTAIVTTITIVGCGGNELELNPVEDAADTVLFERGEEAMADENWTRAREYFETIRDNYPQSVLRDQARLRIIDTYEGEDNEVAYSSALTELREFQRLYPPTHELAPTAQFKIAMVFYNQMKRPEREQTQTRAAIYEFEQFISDYSDSADPELITEARVKLREARDRLSEASFIVGRFYYRIKNYLGAMDRFREILDDDPGYTRRDVVYYYLADSLTINGFDTEALPMFERLVSEFPESEYVSEAAQQIASLKTQLELEDR